MTATETTTVSPVGPTIVRRGTDLRAPAPGGRAGRRRSTIILVVALVLLLGTAVITQATRPRTDDTPVSPLNPEPDGARAAAQILGQHGVDVTYVTTTAAAVAEAEAGTTLLIVDPTSLREVQQEAIAGTAADVVLTGLDGGDLSALTDHIAVGGYATFGEHAVDCDDPDAQAAGTITSGGALVTGDVDASCFATVDGALYASWQQDGTRWRTFSDPYPLSNAGLATTGNAALVLRTLGVHDRLVWYVPDPDDAFGSDAPDLIPLPSVAVLQLVLVGVALVLWRGRRLGRVVVEPLPVVVKATETTRGRGRLYRRARAHSHAGSALRAGMVARVAGRLGLPGHAPPEQVVETLARASGRPQQAIWDVLYGPPPTTDESLITLTHALDTLEREVQSG